MSDTTDQHIKDDMDRTYVERASEYLEPGAYYMHDYDGRVDTGAGWLEAIKTGDAFRWEGTTFWMELPEVEWCGDGDPDVSAAEGWE